MHYSTWKTPIPRYIPELSKRKDLETLYLLLLINATNRPTTLKSPRGEPIELQKGELIFNRKEWNAKFGLPQNSRIILRRLHELKNASSPRMSLRIKRNCIVVTLHSYEETTSLVTQNVTHTYYREKKERNNINRTKQIEEIQIHLNQFVSDYRITSLSLILDPTSEENKTFKKSLSTLLEAYDPSYILDSIINYLTYFDQERQVMTQDILHAVNSEKQSTKDTQKAGAATEYVTTDEFMKQYFPELLDM